MDVPSAPVLAGTRVLDLTRFAAGPWATCLLADLGADVIKIEHPENGDGARHFDDVFGPAMSSYFVGLNRSKRSLGLDLGSRAGQRTLLRMVERCDVLVENFRTDWMAEHGMATAELRAANPRLISVSLTPFGRLGPMATLPGMDIIAQATGGVMGLTGERDREPCRTGPPVADFTSSFLMFAAVLLGLYHRERTGEGLHVDSSLLAGQLALLPNFMSGFAATGQPDGPYGSGHPQLVPYQAFRTSDGWVVIGCLTEAHWTSLCSALDRTDLAADERFSRNVDRVRNRAQLVDAVQAITEGRSRSEWIHRLQHAGVPVAPVNTLSDLLQHEQVAANGMLATLQWPAGAVVVANPLQVRDHPSVPPGPPPLLGEHSAAVLAELGFTPDEIRELADGAVYIPSPPSSTR